MILSILGVSLMINFRVFGIVYSGQDSRKYLDFFCYYQILAILPLLPLVLPTLLVICRSYGIAYMLTLFDALQSSTTEFKDKEDVDEFDAAPAPTKDFKLSRIAIFRKFTYQLFNDDDAHPVTIFNEG
jgi:hypothetical protein